MCVKNAFKSLICFKYQHFAVKVSEIITFNLLNKLTKFIFSFLCQIQKYTLVFTLPTFFLPSPV